MPATLENNTASTKGGGFLMPGEARRLSDQGCPQGLSADPGVFFVHSPLQNISNGTRDDAKRKDRFLKPSLPLVLVSFLLALAAPTNCSVALAGQRTPAVRGIASYYTTESCQREGTSGVRTANGEVNDEADFTCALRSHHFGDRYQVCVAARPHLCVVVRHNDYGPGVGPATQT